MDYLNSGVDVNKGNSFVSIIKDITKNKNIGGFSGIYEYNNIKLVASTDGVGTKLELCKKINIILFLFFDFDATFSNLFINTGGNYEKKF